MLIYILLFLLLIILIRLKDISHNSSNKKKYLFFVEVCFIAIAGFAYKVGVDSARYMNGFTQYPTWSEFSFSSITEFRYEPLWVLLNIAIQSSINEFWGVSLVCAILVNISLFVVLRKYASYPFLTLLIYMLFMEGWLNTSFEMLRQSCAMAFYLWGVMSLLEGNKIFFLIKTIPTLFFHQTGVIIVILTILFTYIPVGKRSYVVAALFLTASIMLKEFLPQLTSLINIISADSAETYDKYLSSQYGMSQANWKGYIIAITTKFLLPLFAIKYAKGTKTKTYQQIMLLYLYLSAFSSVLGIFFRLACYCQFFVFIVYADMFIAYRTQSKRPNYLLPALLIICMITVSTPIKILNGQESQYKVNGHDVRYIPYTNIFTKEYVPGRDAAYDVIYSPIYK